LEFLLGTAVMMALIGALGLPAPAVGLYLLTASVIALYSHANLRVPASLDRQLNRLIVTPAVHAVHHSDLQEQTDSNYGSVLTLWDRFFGTYVGPENARIPHFGLAYFHQPKDRAWPGYCSSRFCSGATLITLTGIAVVSNPTSRRRPQPSSHAV